MLNEKELARLMKNAWKAGGYTVLEYGVGDLRRFLLSGGTWMVVCNAAQMPAKARGLLAEHMGFLPKGAAFLVRKDFPVQDLVDSVPMSDYSAIIAGVHEVLRPTRLTLDGMRVWQNEAGEVMLFNEELTGLICTHNIEICRSGNNMVADIGSEFAAIHAEPEQAHPGTEELEKIAWTNWEDDA